jgi:hypothetical protein
VAELAEKKAREAIKISVTFGVPKVTAVAAFNNSHTVD